MHLHNKELEVKMLPTLPNMLYLYSQFGDWSKIVGLNSVATQEFQASMNYVLSLFLNQIQI